MNNDDTQWPRPPEDLIGWVEAFIDTVERAAAAWVAPKTGMQVPFHGDFGPHSMTPSGLNRLKWWTRALKTSVDAFLAVEKTAYEEGFRDGADMALRGDINPETMRRWGE